MTDINMPLASRWQIEAMGNTVFRCPATGMYVQHWLAEEVTPETPMCTYETVMCKACARIHFINRRTGKLLGDVAAAVNRRSANVAS